MSRASSSAVVRHPFRLITGDGQTIYCDVRASSVAESSPVPVVIFAHGFRGHKDWGPFPYVCERLAATGLCVVSFNFTHTGIEADGDTFTRPDLSVRNTVSREVDELALIVDAVAGGAQLPAVMASKDRIGLMGHSRGGGVAIIAAAEDARVRCVAVWSPVARFDRFSRRQKRVLRETGRLEFSGTPVDVGLPIGVGFLDDLETSAERLDIARATANLHRPLLIVHGEQDLIVRIDEAERLAGCGDVQLTTLTRLGSTNHTFGAVHPFNAPGESLQRAIVETANFFQQHLAQDHH